MENIKFFMVYKSKENKEFKTNSSETFSPIDDCKVSKASKEIMLDRFSNGNGIDFPFSE